MKIVYSSELVQDNLQEVWESIPFSIYEEGKNWYKQANLIAQDLSQKYSIGVDEVCGIIACLSPQKAWFLNLRLAEQFIKEKKCGHVRNLVTKAQLITDYTNLYQDKDSYIRRILNGYKISNFYMNLRYPEDPNYVTIDVHQMQLMTQLPGITTVTNKQYDFLKKEVIIFAKQKQLIPCEVQAITWTYFKDAKWGRV